MMEEYIGFYDLDPNYTTLKFPTVKDLEINFNKFPVGLINLWKKHGWSSYFNQLFWTVNPVEYKVKLEEFGLNSTILYVFSRTSFGDLFCWDGNEVLRIAVHFGVVDSWGRMDHFFNLALRRQQFLEDIMNLELHKECQKDIGELKENEMYGFEPALALGGLQEVDNVRIYDTIIHLSILSQMNNLEQL